MCSGLLYQGNKKGEGQGFPLAHLVGTGWERATPLLLQSLGQDCQQRVRLACPLLEPRV